MQSSQVSQKKSEPRAPGSFRHYATGIEGVVEIELDWIGRKRERIGPPLRVKLMPTLSPRDGEKDGAPRM